MSSKQLIKINKELSPKMNYFFCIYNEINIFLYIYILINYILNNTNINKFYSISYYIYNN